jgi:hypothetical protein
MISFFLCRYFLCGGRSLTGSFVDGLQKRKKCAVRLARNAAAREQGLNAADRYEDVKGEALALLNDDEVRNIVLLFCGYIRTTKYASKSHSLSLCLSLSLSPSLFLSLSLSLSLPRPVNKVYNYWPLCHAWALRCECGFNTAVKLRGRTKAVRNREALGPLACISHRRLSQPHGG